MIGGTPSDAKSQESRNILRIWSSLVYPSEAPTPSVNDDHKAYAAVPPGWVDGW